MNPYLFRRLMEAAAEGGGGAGSGGDSAPDPAVRAELERRATAMGWSPKDQWRGDPKHWIDAEAFLKRGEEVMPLLQANNRKLEIQVHSLSTQLQQATQQLTAAQESIEVLKGLGAKQTVRDGKARRKELLRQQAEARRDNNTELEVELGEQISELGEVIKGAEEEIEAAPAAKKKGAAGTGTGTGTPPAQDPANDPAYIAWKAENPWFGVDEYRSAIAVAAGQRLKRDPTTAGLVGPAFFSKVSEEVNKFFAVHQAATRTSGSKVEGAGGGGNGGGSGSDASGGSNHSWNDLPADAKAACERQAQRVVGEGRAFKTLAEWKKHYVQKYFE